MMVCTECGKKVAKGSAFCEACGAVIDMDAMQAQSTESKAKAVRKGVAKTVSDLFAKNEKQQDSSDKKTSGRKWGPILVVVAVLLVAILIIIAIPGKASDESYVIFEKEDELVFYDKGKELLTLDFEGEYEIVLNDGKFALLDQSGDDGYYGLYAGYIKKNADIEEITDKAITYDYGNDTFAYIEAGDKQLLYVGKLGEMDDAVEVDKDVVDVRVSGDGKAVYYTNLDDEVYVYNRKETDRLAKDAAISRVGEGANEVVLIEDISDEEVSLVWYKKGKDFVVAKALYAILYTDDDHLGIVFISDWDVEEGSGTLYYTDKYGKDPVEMDDGVSEVYLDTDLMVGEDADPEYVFYLKDEEIYYSKIGAEGEGEAFASQDDGMSILAYDTKYNIIFWYEELDEISYLKLDNRESGTIDLDDEFVQCEYADDVLVYENADKEVYFVGADGEVELFSGMYWQLIDSRYIFAVTGEDQDTEAYLYDMRKGQEVLLAEEVVDVQVLDDTAYALGDFDREKGEGVVYRLDFGKNESIELDDDVRQIVVIKN